MHTYISDPKVMAKFESYPEKASAYMHMLRDLILETANELDLADVVEVLKWGEPSYKAKKGSAIRIDYKLRSPDECAMYFTCSTSLVSTFREVFGDVFSYEGNRALVFQLDQELPTSELKSCIAAALRYGDVKKLKQLGIPN